MKLFIILCITLFAEVKCKNIYRFDYTYYPEIGGSIKFHVIPDRWPSANHRCIAEGSMMAWPRDKKTLDIMTSILQTHDISRAFIGIHSIYSHGDYASVDGMPITRMQMKWLEGEPDFADGNEDCLVLTKEGYYADVNCSNIYTYLCYKKHDKNIQKNKCGTVDPEYTYNEKTNSCYKLHSRPKHWNNAYKTCYAEGAHLVIINDDEEAEVIKRMIKKGVKYDRSGCRDFSEVLDYFYIGLFNWGVLGWHTVYGDTSYATGKTICEKYSAPPQLEDHCACLKEDSVRIFNAKCYWRQPFICEKSPDSLIVPDRGIF